MAWGIRDKVTGEFYRQRPGRTGWYGDELWAIRIYGDRRAAQRTIDSGQHHVLYPDRTVEPIEIDVVIKEKADGDPLQMPVP